MSNKHGRKRPHTKKYDDLHVIVLRSYISVSYTDKYGGIRTKIRSFTEFVTFDLGTVRWANGPKICMSLVLLILSLSLIVHYMELKPLKEYKDKPTINTSFFTIMTVIATTFFGLYGFGPPFAPMTITVINILIMFCVKPTHPGLILELEKAIVPGILWGLCLEYFIDGICFAS